MRSHLYIFDSLKEIHVKSGINGMEVMRGENAFIESVTDVVKQPT